MNARSFFMSVNNAMAGLFFAIRQERNMRFEVIAFLFVVVLGCWFQVTRFEWIAILIVSILVLMFELMNSAVEYMLDLLKPRLSDRVGQCKDLAAAAVLLASLLAVIVGLIIFVPYLFEL